MAENIEIVDGKLRVTKTPNEIISTMTREELIGKRAEAQTRVDHLQIDLEQAKVEVEKYDNYVQAIDES